MAVFDRILAPTDFSTTSRLAVAGACTLAARLGAEIHLLNVVPLTYTGLGATDMPTVSF